MQAIPISLTHGCLVATIQTDLDDAAIAAFRIDLLARIRDSRATGVILDLSGVRVLDIADFEALRDCISMARLMGARTVLVGLRPGIVSALVDLDAETDDIEATLDLEDAFDRLRPAPDEPVEATPPGEGAGEAAPPDGEAKAGRASEAGS